MNKMILGKKMRELNNLFYVELLGLNHVFHVGLPLVRMNAFYVGLPLVRRNQYVESPHVTHKKKVSFTTRILCTKSFRSQLLIWTVFKIDHLETNYS